MRKMIDFDATIQSFFGDAISWLENRPVRLRCGENKEQKTCEYLKLIKTDPIRYMSKNAVYLNCDKLDGFIEQYVDRNGSLVVNNTLYLAAIRVLDAIGQYHANDYHYTQSELLRNIKQFQIALNRNKILKSTFYKLQTPYYFAQKQK